MFNRRKQLDFRQQIEELLAKAENITALEDTQKYAHVVAMFYLELLASGVDKDNAAILTTSMMYGLKQ